MISATIEKINIKCENAKKKLNETPIKHKRANWGTYLDEHIYTHKNSNKRQLPNHFD